MTTISIHQPEHLPWLGLLDKINKSDIFVILDTVQFEKNYFHNRNKTKGEWLTVPVRKAPLKTPIKNIEIAVDIDWVNKYLSTFKRLNSEEKFFNKYYEWLRNTLNKKYTKLADLNIEILKYFLYQFNINTPIVLASELDLPNLKGSDLVRYICDYFRADVYLSGVGGKNYLKIEDFKQKIVFNEWSGDKNSAIDTLLCGKYPF